MKASLVRFINVMAAILAVRGHGQVAEYVRVLSVSLSESDDVETELQGIVDEIEAMVAEGRNPTPADFIAARERRQALSAQIRTTAIAVDEEE